MYLMASTQGMPALDLHLRERMHVLSRIVWHYDSSGVQAKRRFGSLYEPILLCVKDKRRYTFTADAIRVETTTGARRHLIDHRKPIPAPYSASKVPGNVWYYPRVRYRMPEYREHPTQKPEALIERMILASSNPGDTVLDLFAGTFTASVVSHRLGRRSIGVELQDEYVNLGRLRLRGAERRGRLRGEIARECGQRNGRNANRGAGRCPHTVCGRPRRQTSHEVGLNESARLPQWPRGRLGIVRADFPA
jgi:site-specific DNA-methyltransferase (adenine-specific)